MLSLLVHIVFKFEKVKLKHLVILLGFLNTSKKSVLNNEHFNLSMVAQMAEQAT